MNAQETKACVAVTRRGLKCKGRAIRGDYCMAHSPELETRRREARVRGGHNSAKAVRLSRAPDSPLSTILDKLSWAIDEVIEGRLPPSAARALASLSAIFLRIHEGVDLEARLARLEAAVDDEPQGLHFDLPDLLTKEK